MSLGGDDPHHLDPIDALIGDISQLRGEVAWLRRANEALRAAHLADNATHRAENEALRAKNEALQAENADLRRRLDLDSSTSSKPPSSDGLKKKPRIPGSLRGRSDKKAAGRRDTRATRSGRSRRPIGSCGTKRRRAGFVWRG